MKIFNLSDKNNYKLFNKDLQDNLNILHKLYGNKFYILCNIDKTEYKIPVLLRYPSSKYQKLKYYTLQYYIQDRHNSLFPFKIEYYDFFELKLNNNCYIANIHKTNTISGQVMVKFVIELNRILGVQKAILFDGASVLCGSNPIDLSFMKLLENNNTFYMKLGFDIEIDPRKIINIRYPNKNTKKKYLIKLVKKVKLIKNTNIIAFFENLLDLCVRIIKNSEYNKLKIYISYNKNNNYSKFVSSQHNIFELINKSISILDILKQSKEKYLYKTMINLFNDKNNCHKLVDLLNIIELTDIVKIEYKNTKINYKIFNDLISLSNIRYTYYSYTYYT